MPDVPEQLRAYGDAVEADLRSGLAETKASGRVRGRPPRRLAVAAVATAVAIGLSVAIARSTDDGSRRVSTAPTASFCRAADLAVRDAGPLSIPHSVLAGYQEHRLVVANRGHRPCLIDGAPDVEVQSPSGDAHVQSPSVKESVGGPVVLRPGKQASAVVAVRDMPEGPLCHTPAHWRLALSDRGGRIALQSAMSTSCAQVVALTNFVAGDEVRSDREVTVEPSVTATLRLETPRVRPGEDILGRITFRNRTGKVFSAGWPGDPPCLQQWQLAIGRRRPNVGSFTVCLSRATVTNRVVVLRPGRSEVPFVLENVGCLPQVGCRSRRTVHTRRTKVWLSVPAALGHPRPAKLTVTAVLARPTACTSSEVGIGNAGAVPPSLGDGGAMYRLVVINTSHRPCRIDGAPQVGASPVGYGWRQPVLRRAKPVVLQPGERGSFLVAVGPDPVADCPPEQSDSGGLWSWVIQMPDQPEQATFGGMPGVGGSCGRVTVWTNVVKGARGAEALLHTASAAR